MLHIGKLDLSTYVLKCKFLMTHKPTDKGLPIIFLIGALFFSLNTYSQHLISGSVIDSETKDPLAFVNIIFDKNTLSGTATNIDGKFLYNSKKNVSKLSFSYVGYENLTINIDTIENKSQLKVELKPGAFQLQEISIIAGENPANRIIRKVIENKKINDPENILSFEYTSYNKNIFDLKPFDKQNSDSVQIDIDKTLKGGHMLIMESVTKRKFIKPDLDNETILGTKVSGFKNPSFAALANNIQPFSFYKERINIFDINYLNPISKGSLRKYQFNIEDTLIQKTDTTFILSFKPKSNKNFDGLTGLLYINTNLYAVQNVIAEPFEKGFIDIKIQQKYRFIDDKQWFPEELNFEFIIRQYPSKDVGTSGNGKSYIKNIELLADLDKKDFPLESITMEALANERDSLFWKKYRLVPLNKKEISTYEVIDSFGEEYKFDAILKISEKAALNRIPIKFIDLDISKSLIYNNYEGVRLGLGAYTNEKLNKFLSVGGFLGYGLKDHQWKYGGGFILSIDKESELELHGMYQNSLRETGQSGLNFFKQDLYDLRAYQAAQMDRIQENSLSVGFRFIKYAKLNFSLNHSRVSPQYDYRYRTADQEITDYVYSDFRIKLRYAYKEKLIKSMNQRISMGTKYPVLNLSYSRGFKGFYGSELNFNKLEARIEQSFYLKNLGETKIRIDAGLIDTPLPYGLLFTGEGSYDKKLHLIMKNNFQTATPYEFLSDRYINFYFSHNFGALLFRTKKFAPHISLIQNMGWGRLAHPEYHQIQGFKTKDKGLYESGLLIDNIFKMNYLNIAYLGIGAGIFYRYGPYAYKNVTDNIAIKFSFTFSTK